jgi:hypothetical protein
MSEWHSIDEIILEFELGAPAYDLDSLWLELSQKRNALHPDRFGGDFKSDDHKQQYTRICDALDFIRNAKEKGLAVIPVSQLPMIIESVTRALAIRQQTDLQIAQAKSSLKASYNREISLALRLPRISSAIAGAIAAAAFAFWGNISANPVLSSLSSLSLTQILWSEAFLLSGAIFLATYWYEQYTQSYLDLLLSEDGLLFLVRKLISITTKDQSHVDAQGNLRFSKRELVQVIKSLTTIGESWWLHLFSHTLSENTAAECADVVLAKLEKRGMKRVDQGDIDEWSLLPQKVVEALKPTESAEKSDQPIRTSTSLSCFSAASMMLLLMIVMLFLVVAVRPDILKLPNATPSTTITTTPSVTATETPLPRPTASYTPLPTPTHTATTSQTPMPTGTVTALPNATRNQP